MAICAHPARMVKRAFSVFSSAKLVNPISSRNKTMVDIDALAARFVDPTLWNKAVGDEFSPILPFWRDGL